MTIYEEIKNKILKEGYRIEKRIFTRSNLATNHKLNPPVTLYEVNKVINEKEKTTTCEIAHDIAMLLKKELNIEIFNDGKQVVALNFMPIPVTKGCIRTFHL